MKNLTLATAAINYVMAADDLEQYHQQINYEDASMANDLEKKNDAYMSALTLLREQVYTEMGMFNVDPRPEIGGVAVEDSRPVGELTREDKLRYFVAALQRTCGSYDAYVDCCDGTKLEVGFKGGHWTGPRLYVDGLG